MHAALLVARGSEIKTQLLLMWRGCACVINILPVCTVQSARSRGELSWSSGSVKYLRWRHCVLWDYELQNIRTGSQCSDQISWILEQDLFDHTRIRYMIRVEYQMCINKANSIVRKSFDFWCPDIRRITRNKTCPFECKIETEMTA